MGLIENVHADARIVRVREGRVALHARRKNTCMGDEADERTRMADEIKPASNSLNLRGI